MREDETVGWCKNNFLLLNVKKTKEITVYFRTSTHVHKHILINGDEVETVNEYK